MALGKRSRAAAPVYQRKKRRLPIQPRALRALGTRSKDARLATRMRYLLQGKTKDTPVISVVKLPLVLDTGVGCCLTCSETGFSGTATSGTAMIVGDMDQADINNVHIKGRLSCNGIPSGTTAAAHTGSLAPRVRCLVVWFNDLPNAPVAGGTLPLISDVLVGSATVDSFVQPDNFRQGRFQVLYDKVFDLRAQSGTAFTAGGGYIGYSETLDVKIPINKVQHYKKPATSTLAGGHFDSDVDEGQISRGCPMLYVVGNWDTGGSIAWDVDASLLFRTNYTA